MDREATESEITPWLEKKALNPVELSSQLFRYTEFTRVYGVHPGPSGDEVAERKTLQYMVNLLNQDLYSEYISKRSASDPRQPTKFRRLHKQIIRIATNLFRLDKSGLSLIQTKVERDNRNVAIEIQGIDVHTILNNNNSIDADILITNNNDLYNSFSEQLTTLASSEYVSVCWLWDNHHQFGLSSDVAQHFDLVFPAHSNGHTYLHAARAIVGSVQPCAIFQWTPSEANFFFKQYRNTNRSNSLYGHFNAYKGRCALRDEFLQEASRSYSIESVKVIDHHANNWSYKSAESHFREMIGYKTIICNPIFNDVPARLLDALVVGAIPIVPHGLPDLNRCFNTKEQLDLPIITYVPNTLHPLGLAIDRAIELFDRGGEEGALKRHEIAINHHFVHHRIADMISEIIMLAKQC